MKSEKSNKSDINKFFVYGTLRPDIEAPWSDIVHKNPNFKLIYYMAHLSHSKIYLHKNIGYAVTIYDKSKFRKTDTTIGYLLETDNVDATLEVFDNIEGYPTLYDRIKVRCYNANKKIDEFAYLYTMHKNMISESDLLDIKVNDYKLVPIK